MEPPGPALGDAEPLIYGVPEPVGRIMELDPGAPERLLGPGMPVDEEHGGSAQRPMTFLMKVQALSLDLRLGARCSDLCNQRPASPCSAEALFLKYVTLTFLGDSPVVVSARTPVRDVMDISLSHLARRVEESGHQCGMFSAMTDETPNHG